MLFTPYTRHVRVPRRFGRNQRGLSDYQSARCRSPLGVVLDRHFPQFAFLVRSHTSERGHDYAMLEGEIADLVWLEESCVLRHFCEWARCLDLLCYVTQLYMLGQ